MKIFGMLAAAVLLIVVLDWLLTANGLALYQYYGPKFESARRSVYQETPSFLNGNRQNLLNQVAVIRGTQDSAARQQLKSALRVMVNGLPADFEIPSEVRQVLSEP